MEIFRWVAIAFLAVFGAYTLYALWTEPFFKSIKAIFAYRWGRQVTADLYAGILMFSFIIYLNEGSIPVTLAWMASALVIGNPVTLLYFILNFDSLISHFMVST